MPSGALWRHPDFVRLWAAQAVSAFGSRVTRTALPIIAITVLGASDGWVSILTALQFAPGVILALFAGGYVDRHDHRAIMIACDWLRAALVASIPLAAWAGLLSLPQLIVVGAGVGAATALFLITDKAYLPRLIARADLPEGNAKLEATEAVAEIGGPAVGGALIRAVGAPLAMVVDAASYVWSALFLRRIEAAPAAPEPSPPAVLADLRLGLRAIFGHRLLRPIILTHVVWAVSGGFFMTLYTPYCLKVLALDEAALGIVIGAGGVGALIGASLAGRVVARLGLGPAMIGAATLSLAGALLIPLARGGYWTKIAFLLAHQLVSDGLAVIFIIQAVSVRQAVLPGAVLGRANAAAHLATAALIPFAALAAGGLAELAGTRTAMWTGVMIGLAAPLCLLPIAGVRSVGDAASDSDGDSDPGPGAR